MILEKDKVYLYRGLSQAYTVRVLKVGRFRSLCMWKVQSSSMGLYVNAGFKWNWRFIGLAKGGTDE